MRAPGSLFCTYSIVGLTVILTTVGVAAQPSAPPQSQPPAPEAQAAQEQPPASQPDKQPNQQKAAPPGVPMPASPIGEKMTPFTLPAAKQPGDAPAITEEQLRRQLVGKAFYLRGGYLDNSLHFDASGKLDGNSPRASHTLSLVEIERAHLEKHRVQLEGVRYGLHFLDEPAAGDQTQAIDRVRLTTKKKPVRIDIDREQVEKPKKEKAPKSRKHGDAPPAAASAPASPASKASAAAPAHPQGATESTPGDAGITSQAQANLALIDALDRVFAAGIDDRMIATLPDYWRVFYKSAAERHDYRPADPAVLRQSQVSQKAKLLSAFEPPSNEYAQKNGVAGMALYHVVVGADGKPQEIAVGRPIGFGLDENAVDSIRKSSFEAAIKDGKPVPVVLDLLVQFRIFSRRTGATSDAAAAAPAAPSLPGPYTANQPQPAPQPQTPPLPQ